ncbi:hypothetical protein [Neptunitalea lumnitzerae]|nr:hypothetical protein [Neptunitalea sp. Y10]
MMFLFSPLMSSFDYIIIVTLTLFFLALGYFSFKARLVNKENTTKSDDHDIVNDYRVSNFGVPGQIRAVKTYDRGVFIKDSDHSKIYNNQEINEQLSQKDDLQLIEGVGPAIEKRFNDNGIFTYEQLTHLPKEDKKTISKVVSFLPKQIDIEYISSQAKLFSNNKEFSA